MKNLPVITLAALVAAAVIAPIAAQTPNEARPESAAPQPPTPHRGLKLTEFFIHDPWILAEPSTQTYYLYTSAPARQTGLNRTGTFVYKSKDLATWEGPFVVFAVPDGGWADPQVGAWAPEVQAYKGKYYLFTTLHNPAKSLPTLVPSRPNLMRATMIAVGDSPEGPFTLTKKDGPITPPNFMTLDGTLYVDPAGKPWMVYAHEWIQKIDGTIEALPLNDELSAAAGDPIQLFKGSDAPWLNEQAVPSTRSAIYVTDGPEFFRTKTGRLLMLWSSYEKNSLGRDGYVETLARSKTGDLKGPWEQLPPLVRNDSGHGMLFRTFAGQLMLVMHQPFVSAHAKIYEMEDLGDNLRVVNYREDLSGPPLGPQQGQTPQ